MFCSIFPEGTVKKGCQDHCSQENSATATATQLPFARNCTWIPWIFWVSWGIAPSNLQTSSIGALMYWVCLIFKKEHQQTSKTNVYDECHTSLGFFRGISPEVLGWHEKNTISTFFESEGQWYGLWTIHVADMLEENCQDAFQPAILAISGMWSARCASSCRIMRWGRGYFMFFSPDRSPKLTEDSLNSADPDLGTRFFSCFMFSNYHLTWSCDETSFFLFTRFWYSSTSSLAWPTGPVPGCRKRWSQVMLFQLVCLPWRTDGRDG